MFPRILLTIALFGVGLGLLFSPTDSSAENTESQDAEVRKLVMQKRDILKQKVEWLTQAQTAGDASAQGLPDAKMELLAVELELATSQPERITILESRLKNRREMEEQMTQLYRTGDGSQEQLLNAKVQHVDAQIELLREAGTKE